MSGGPEDQQGGPSVPEVTPADFMSVNGQAEFKDRGSASHATQVSCCDVKLLRRF